MSHRNQIVRASIAILSAGMLVGCGRQQPPPEAHSQPLVASSAVPEGLSASTAPNSAVDSPPSGTQSPAARATDERWQRAKGEDLADKQALADALGATGLVEALDDGGDIATTALLCLPLADDADLALAPLAKRLSSSMNEWREAYLVAILGIAGRPARSRESMDPEGAVEAGEAILAIAKNDGLPKEHRALAISAARALAEKKIVDPAKIPTDLDPP